jgi:hypothetical protein
LNLLNKFKIKRCELKIADILSLELDKRTYGWQKVEEKYIIWKHAVKWRRYAEINSRNEALLFEGFDKKKKRRKIEVLFNCFQTFNLARSIKENKIYNVFTKKNLDFIIRKAVKKKNSIWKYFEDEEDVNNFNLTDNWKVKKPPDKIVNVELLLCCKSSKEKIEKFNGKKKKKRRRERIINCQSENVSKKKSIVKIVNDQELCKIRSTPEEVNSFEEVNEKLLFSNRSLVEIGQAYCKDDLEDDLAAEYKTIQVTEGEKIIRRSDTIIGDEDVSANGHGYKCVKSRNIQEVHF